jgi:DNA processing protein
MNTNEDILIYQLAITELAYVGDVMAKQLISYCGSAEAVFKETKSNLQKIPGIGQIITNGINEKNKAAALEKAEKEIEFIQKNRIQPIYYLDDAYPWRLKNCLDGPVMVFFDGNGPLNHSRVISIVGTRNATDYGIELVEKTVAGLKKYDVMIVSGLAYGIDINAHKMSLKHEIPTIGVVAHGLHTLYPMQHYHVAEKMKETGGVITEFRSGKKPDRENFPRRNRIIAGMSDAVLVVESGRSGGAMITAKIADSYNKDVFAVPGRLTDKYSKGTNELIRSNLAGIFTSVDAMAAVMGWQVKGDKEPEPKPDMSELDEHKRKIIELLYQYGTLSIEKMIAITGIKPSSMLTELLELEFSGWVKPVPGNQYKIIR